MTTDAQKNEKVERHPAIILLAALQIIAGLQLIYTAISSFLAAKSITPEFEQEIIARLPAALSHYTVQILLAFGIVTLLIGVLCLFTAKGYLRGSEKARKRGIRIAIIAIIIGIIGFIILPIRLEVSSPFLIIMFNLAVILYLHSPNVRSYFGARK